MSEPTSRPRDAEARRYLAQRRARIERVLNRSLVVPPAPALPPERRRAIHATYAYCRIADDIADHARDLARAECALDDWERQLEAPTDPVAVAFAAARAQYNVPEAAVRELLAGVRMDLRPCSFAAWEDLRLYAYRVAGTVGLMVAPILGCQDEWALPYAVDLGIAMQLSNVLRDIGEDARRGPSIHAPSGERGGDAGSERHAAVEHVAGQTGHQHALTGSGHHDREHPAGQLDP